jgi:hypothetical protein
MSTSADDPSASIAQPSIAAGPFRLEFKHVAVVLLLASACIVLWRLFPLSSKDLWTHLKYGEWICNHRSLPDKEPFCTPEDSAQELTHSQWLTQAAFYQTYRLGEWLAGGSDMNRLAGGVEMLRLALALLILARMVFLTIAFQRQTGSLFWALIALAVSLILTWTNLVELRPHVVGEVFFAALLMLLSRKIPSRAGTIAAIPLFALWANCHASFLGGFGLVALCIVARFLDRSRYGLSFGDLFRRDLRTRRLTIILVVGIIAVGFLNPHGWKLYDQILTVDGHPNGLLLAEWQPLRMERTFGWHWLFLASMLVAVGTHLLSPRGFSAGDLLMLFAFAATACIQQHMLVYWAMILPWILAPHWLAIGGREAVASEVVVRPQRKGVLIAAGIVIGGLVAATPLTAWLANGRPAPLSESVDVATPWALAMQLQSEPNPEPTAFPELHRVLAEHYPNGRFRGKIMVDPKRGDFLLWRALPINVYSQLVFFTAKYWTDQDFLLQCNPGWWETFDIQEVNMVVLGPDDFAGLRGRLLASAGWQLLHRPGPLADPHLGSFDGWILLRKKPAVE